MLRERGCRLFELASDFEMPLREFHTADDVMSQFSRTHSNGDTSKVVHLQLYVLGAGPQFVPRRVSLNPSACNGATFRYAAHGWGLIQLYLGTIGNGGIKNSHTNHNSLKRAKAWASATPDLHPVESWDFTKITAFSSRLNRQIRNMRVAKIGSRAILPGALRLWEQGVSLLPFRRDSSVEVVRTDA